MAGWKLGVIGGSGLYDIPGVEGAWKDVRSPWGDASDAVFDGALAGVPMAFLPRHGRGHRIPPTQVNYRANIDALKRLGCTDILSLSACGSLRQDRPPGVFVIVDQYIDRTFAREKSFFGPGLVAHVSMAHPVCPRLSGLAAQAARQAGAEAFEGGPYRVMGGPQFSSLAESRLYRSWGCDVIGMTNMPEAKLAREAELPYASVAMVTDFDCWHEEVAHVQTTDILEVLHKNSDTAKMLVKHIAQALAQTPREPSPIDSCLDHALITAPGARDPALVAKLPAMARRAVQA
ncbi:MAG: S-methyl-5'-thioadenosine phosphorylase [Alphaproteobacteria bacterium]|nr:S-methyl-5'-thioadenosine phosphorylase [Alphaproteobacteria bacterium]